MPIFGDPIISGAVPQGGNIVLGGPLDNSLIFDPGGPPANKFIIVNTQQDGKSYTLRLSHSGDGAPFFEIVSYTLGSADTIVLPTPFNCADGDFTVAMSEPLPGDFDTIKVTYAVLFADESEQVMQVEIINDGQGKQIASIPARATFDDPLIANLVAEATTIGGWFGSTIPLGAIADEDILHSDLTSHGEPDMEAVLSDATGWSTVETGANGALARGVRITAATATKYAALVSAMSGTRLSLIMFFEVTTYPSVNGHLATLMAHHGIIGAPDTGIDSRFEVANQSGQKINGSGGDLTHTQPAGILSVAIRQDGGTARKKLSKVGEAFGGEGSSTSISSAGFGGVQGSRLGFSLSVASGVDITIIGWAWFSGSGEGPLSAAHDAAATLLP